MKVTRSCSSGCRQDKQTLPRAEESDRRREVQLSCAVTVVSCRSMTVTRSRGNAGLVTADSALQHRTNRSVVFHNKNTKDTHTHRWE